ncbi:hypothetical protein MTO96_046158 [Rhipicephalus appendiculatus]
MARRRKAKIDRWETVLEAGRQLPVVRMVKSKRMRRTSSVTRRLEARPKTVSGMKRCNAWTPRMQRSWTTSIAAESAEHEKPVKKPLDNNAEKSEKSEQS